jgi:hypothetical protein
VERNQVGSVVLSELMEYTNGLYLSVNEDNHPSSIASCKCDHHDELPLPSLFIKFLEAIPKRDDTTGTKTILNKMRCSTDLAHGSSEVIATSMIDLDGESEVPILRLPNFLGLVNMM